MSDTPVDGRSLPGSVPTTLGKYTLLVRLAAGGMGEVYVARMSAAAGFEKNVVIKRLLPQYSQDEQFVQMFLDEARLTARLSHPNICQVFELIEHGEEFYLVMEYLEGLPLSRMMASRAPRGLDLRIAAGIAVQACEGLAYAHEFRDPAFDIQGIIHRDVSPHNLMVTTSGLVKLLDFGVAKLHREGSLTVTGSAKGKYGYMSPEQIECHPLDRRSDLFSLGVVLFELITGMRLFRHNSDLATLQAIVNGTRPRLTQVRPDVPDAVERVVDRALSVNRDHRFSTTRMLAEALTHAVAPLGGPASLGELSRFLATEHIIDLESQRALIASADARLERDSSPSMGSAGQAGESSRSSRRRMHLPLEAPDHEYTRPITSSGARRGSASGIAQPVSPLVALAAPAAPRFEPAPAEALPASPHTGLTELSGMAVPDLSPSGSRVWLPLLLLAVCAAAVVMWWQTRSAAVKAPLASASMPAAEPERTPATAPARPVEPLTAQEIQTATGNNGSSASRSNAKADGAENLADGAENPAGGAEHLADGAENLADKDKDEDSEARSSKARSSKSRTSKRRRKAPPRETAEASGTGYFTVDASPYATIYIDDRKMGVTPLVRVELSAGEHSVRAVTSDGQVKRLKVRVGAGETTRKRILFD